MSHRRNVSRRVADNAVGIGMPSGSDAVTLMVVTLPSAAKVYAGLTPLIDGDVLTMAIEYQPVSLNM